MFETSVHSHEPGPTFARDFGSRKLQKDINILDMARRNLPAEWDKVMRTAMAAKIAVQEEVENASIAHVRLVSPVVCEWSADRYQHALSVARPSMSIGRLTTSLS